MDPIVKKGQFFKRVMGTISRDISRVLLIPMAVVAFAHAVIDVSDFSLPDSDLTLRAYDRPGVWLLMGGAIVYYLIVSILKRVPFGFKLTSVVVVVFVFALPEAQQVDYMDLNVCRVLCIFFVGLHSAYLLHERLLGKSRKPKSS